MKKTLFSFVTFSVLLVSTQNVQAQLKVANGGNVGIGLPSGTNPNYNLEVNGNTSLKGLTVNGNTLFTNLVTMEEHVPIAGSPLLRVKGNALIGEFEINKYLLPNVVGDIMDIPIFISKHSRGGEIGTHSYPMREVHAINFCGNHQVVSDKRMKSNIQKLNNLNRKKLNEITVYTYDMNEPFYNSIKNEDLRNSMKAKKGKQIGLMAQEVKEIYPELVRYDSINDLYSINYVGFIPHLIQAVQELKNDNELLKTQNELLTAEILSIQQNCCKSSAKPKTKSLQTLQNNEKVPVQAAEESVQILEESARLDQNIPNPFTEGTTISYFIPKETKQANMYIYTLTGAQIKHISLTEKGEGQIQINGNDLSAGMYLYTLILDNQPIDTKRMILTN